MEQENVEQMYGMDELNMLKTNSEIRGFAIDTNDENKKELQNLIKRDSGGSSNENIEREFKYCTEDGEEQYRIIQQKRGQRFVVQRRTSNGPEYNLKDTKRIPYNLPYLKQNEGSVVWVVNGEDKVDYLKSIKIVATTAPFNSPNKWEKDFNKYLVKSAGVIVLDENKKSAETYVNNTFNTIKNANLNVGIVYLKELAALLNIELEENSTLLHLAQKIDNRKLNELLVQVEQQILR